MKCLSCEAPDIEADRCSKCGYAFIGTQTDSVAVLASIERMVRTIKNVLIWWMVLTLVGGALWVVASVHG